MSVDQNNTPPVSMKVAVVAALAVLAFVAAVVVIPPNTPDTSVGATDGNTTVNETTTWTDRVVFEDDGVVCYIRSVEMGGGMSCLPIEETEVNHP